MDRGGFGRECLRGWLRPLGKSSGGGNRSILSFGCLNTRVHPEPEAEGQGKRDSIADSLHVDHAWRHFAARKVGRPQDLPVRQYPNGSQYTFRKLEGRMLSSLRYLATVRRAITMPFSLSIRTPS